MIDDCRALTMYEETKNEIFFDGDAAKLVNWEFLIFLAIITTPMLVFRGSYEQFLKYVEVPVTKNNLEAVRNRSSPIKRGAVLFGVLYDTDSYFTATLKREVEKKMQININMVRYCKEIAAKANKRSWIPLLKTWIGVQMLTEEGLDVITMRDLCDVTGLSEYQIRESKKLLDGYDSDKVFVSSPVYARFNRCLGTHYDLNGFVNMD